MTSDFRADSMSEGPVRESSEGRGTRAGKKVRVLMDRGACVRSSGAELLLFSAVI